MPEGFTVEIKGGRTLWYDDYQCQKCGELTEVVLRKGEEAGQCHCGGDRVVVIDKPKDWEFKVTKSDKRIIWSEKQIESSHGKDWRETNNRRTEGGCGARQFFDGGAGRYRPVG